MTPSEDGHLGDKYKLKNHPTFSSESIYSTPEAPGGRWKKSGKAWEFYASMTNLKNMTKEELKRYFDRNEKGNTIIFPDGERYRGKS